jgi:hypothetical protein
VSIVGAFLLFDQVCLAPTAHRHLTHRVTEAAQALDPAAVFIIQDVAL